MPARQLIWESKEPLTDLGFYADWDPVVSMILALRIHLFEHGTIPTWNFMFCHGRPELAVPYSWAWTWPSVFAYTLPPVYAIFAVWIVMSLVGFFSLRALLLRWFASPLGANVGACVYVLGGYFANRFNAGHVTFAFFHWIPLLVYLFDVTFDRALEGRRILWPLLFSLLATFLFISSGLPHPLLHFYPALLLFILCRILRAASDAGAAEALRAASLPVTANLLGIALAAYKLWPVVAWQRAFPREDVRWESYGIVEVFWNTVIFVTDYRPLEQQQAWHLYPAWGYNAFVGLLPWLCGVVAIAAAWRQWNAPAAAQGDRPPKLREDGVLFASLLVLIGITLSMGNDNPWSPAYLFRHLPILDGIRAFNRYQILIVLGLAILTARSFPAVAQWFEGRSERAGAAAWTLAAAVLLPVLAQAFLLAATIPAISNEVMAKRMRLAPAQGAPSYVRARKDHTHQMGQQAVILENGQWVGNCYSNLTLPGEFPRSEEASEPISYPPPERVEVLGHDRIALRYREEAQSAPVRLNLRVLEGFQASPPLESDGEWSTFAAAGLEGGVFTLTAEQPAVAQGRRASGSAALLTALFLAAVARAEARR